jgi:hypothetical protein
MHTSAALAFLLLALPAFAADGVTLIYKGANRWVAPADNAPLHKLQAAAKQGQSHFAVRLPTADRPLSTQRLEIIRDLLAKQNPQGVLLEESDDGPTPAPNTLWVK